MRDDIGIGWEGHQLKGLKVSVADIQAKWPLSQEEGVGYVALTDKGYTIAVPLPGMQRILVAVPDDTPEGQEPKVTLEELAAQASETIGGPVGFSTQPGLPSFGSATTWHRHFAKAALFSQETPRIQLRHCPAKA